MSDADQKYKSLQLQYQGYLNTPILWHNSELYDIRQLQLSKQASHSFAGVMPKGLRLGKRVEHFVFHELSQYKEFDILAENIQIQDGKITAGEMDCLLLKNGKPIHLEIVFKYYLYAPSVGDTSLEHWIGPNRRDSLVEKLEKLKDKQFPLLYKDTTLPYLQKFHLNPDNITQQVSFKAQLFVPYEDYGKQFELVNNDCIYGFYIYRKDLEQFSKSKFYIPIKEDWLQEPQIQIDWMSYTVFKEKLDTFLETKNAPLCWLKQPNGTLLKFFVVWW
ncbi:DUF1853 family protein [Mangrovimonas aestuarii]|uniref:DUF1853 family protein n=1 Tax=Mangrovimonas aestuarii TaxID=3018443 RepID=UPI0023789EBE|nr:DUF1853 family protein [Mangrovimonas aestuarii]